MLAGDYAGAFPLLDKDIFHFPAMTVKAAELTADPLSPYLCSVHEKSCNYIHSASGLTAKLEYQDHMRYYLYGAMCYMALKDWARALLFLEVVLMSPTTNIASVLQVHAYKKWILVSLLRHGKVRHMFLNPMSVLIITDNISTQDNQLPGTSTFPKH